MAGGWNLAAQADCVVVVSSGEVGNVCQPASNPFEGGGVRVETTDQRLERRRLTRGRLKRDKGKVPTHPHTQRGGRGIHTIGVAAPY
jgi:hypothetical protein